MKQKAIVLLDSWSRGDKRERKKIWEAIKQLAVEEQSGGLQLLEFEARKEGMPFETQRALDVYDPDLPVTVDMQFLYCGRRYKVTAKEAKVTIMAPQERSYKDDGKLYVDEFLSCARPGNIDPEPFFYPDTEGLDNDIWLILQDNSDYIINKGEHKGELLSKTALHEVGRANPNDDWYLDWAKGFPKEALKIIEESMAAGRDEIAHEASAHIGAAT